MVKKEFLWEFYFKINFIYLGTPGRCTPGLCQNGGICEERVNGVAVYAFCRCPSGITGQCCQTRKQRIDSEL